MNEIIVASLTAFLAVPLIYPKIKRYLKSVGVKGINQQRPSKPLLPTSGGTIPAVAIFVGLMLFLGITKFVTNIPLNTSYLLAAALTIETITLIGFLDDIYLSEDKQKAKTGTKQIRKGLGQLSKPLMILPAAIPLMVVNAGHSTMHIPYLGTIAFGWIYPIILIPIGLLCVANATNMLAGQNGLETGMATVALLGLGTFTFMLNRLEASALAFIAASALLAFEYYNWAPAKVLQGDSLTYLTGACIATVVLIGNVESFGVIIFIPWIVEALIKASQGFKASSLGRVTARGVLKPVNGKIESLTHLVMSEGNFKEWQVTSIFIFTEAVFVALAFAVHIA